MKLRWPLMWRSTHEREVARVNRTVEDFLHLEQTIVIPSILTSPVAPPSVRPMIIDFWIEKANAANRVALLKCIEAIMDQSDFTATPKPPVPSSTSRAPHHPQSLPPLLNPPGPCSPTDCETSRSRCHERPLKAKRQARRKPVPRGSQSSGQAGQGQPSRPAYEVPSGRGTEVELPILPLSYEVPDKARRDTSPRPRSSRSPRSPRKRQRRKRGVSR